MVEIPKPTSLLPLIPPPPPRLAKETSETKSVIVSNEKNNLDFIMTFLKKKEPIDFLYRFLYLHNLRKSKSYRPPLLVGAAGCAGGGTCPGALGAGTRIGIGAIGPPFDPQTSVQYWAYNPRILVQV